MDDVGVDYSLLNYNTYNDYMMSFVQTEDKRFVPHSKTIRTIIRLGFRSKVPPYDEPEFEKQKAAAEDAFAPKIRGRIMFGIYLSNEKDAVLNALKEREVANVCKTISTIIFITQQMDDGSERTGYIDYEVSLVRASQGRPKSTDWKGVFEHRVQLKPTRDNLSYYDSHSNDVCYNDSDNYVVVHDHNRGLCFMHKGDHKIICVGPKSGGKVLNARRSMHYSDRYGCVILYDHNVRKKN